MEEIMAFLGVDCEAGETRKEKVKIGEYADGTPVLLPVAVVRGQEDGPTLHVQGAIHGDEVTGTAIARRVLQQVDARDMRGRLVVVPACNPPAYLSRTRAWSSEERIGADVWRLLPGWPGGLLSERISNVLLTEFMQAADVAIDLHSALDGANIAPFTYVLSDQGDGTYETTKKLALEFGTPYVWRVDQIDPAELEQQPLSIRAVGQGYAPGTSGNAIFIAEMGESRRVTEEYVDIGADGVRRTMSAMGMLPPADDAPPARREFTKVAPIHVDRGGGLHRFVDVGDEVEEGQVLGRIVDMFGDPLEEITAPISGFVLRAMLLANVATGAEAYWLAD